jgi:hypothetical protein
MFVVHETTSELKTHDLLDHVICQCRKHRRQLTRKEGAFVVCFPLNVSMVHSPKPTIIDNGNTLTDIGFALGETIHFESLEFIINCFSNLSLSP